MNVLIDFEGYQKLIQLTNKTVEAIGLSIKELHEEVYTLHSQAPPADQSALCGGWARAVNKKIGGPKIEEERISPAIWNGSAISSNIRSPLAVLRRLHA